MANNTTIVLLAEHIAAYHNCKAANNMTWLNRHADAVERICKDVLPSGSGIDSGCTIDLDECTGDKIVIRTSYHHMSEGGFYDGWTGHKVTVRPSFIGAIELTIGGRDRNDIKDYLADTFHFVLTQRIEETWDSEKEQYQYRVVDRG